MLVRGVVLSGYFLLVPMVLMIVGCASTSSVSMLGKDTYTLSAYRSDVRGGIPDARKVAVGEAGAYCAKLEKQVLVKDISFRPGPYADNVAVGIIFDCRSANDPEYMRPTD
jgi:hypothetical protein